MDASQTLGHYEALKEQKRLALARLQQDQLSRCEQEALMLADANAQRVKLLSDLDRV